MYINRRKGFTLIEMVVALAIFTILGFAGISLLIYVSETSEKIAFQNELLEHARIALSFMVEQIRISEAFQLVTDSEDSLIRLVCYSGLEGHVFSFDKHLLTESARYGQILFGENELASYIADVKVTIDGSRMEIRIITHSKASELSSVQVEPIDILRKISLRYKEQR